MNIVSSIPSRPISPFQTRNVPMQYSNYFSTTQTSSIDINSLISLMLPVMIMAMMMGMMGKMMSSDSTTVAS
jgi:hypothetical protein